MSVRLFVPLLLASLLLVMFPRTAAAANLGVMIRVDPQERGMLILEVVFKSPAADAGLQVGDIITKVDGNAVTVLADFVKTIREHKAGDKIKLDVLRDGKEKKIDVTLGN